MSEPRSDWSPGGRLFFVFAAADLLICLAVGVWQVSVVVRLFQHGFVRPLVIEGLISLAAYPALVTWGPVLTILWFRLPEEETDKTS